MNRLLFLLAIGVISVPHARAEQTGIIGGVVRNGWSKEPIKRATVTLRTSGPDIQEALTYSEANGAFAFTGVPAGDYTLCARVNGYQRACFGAGNELGRPVPIFNLAPGQLKQNIILPILPDGSVTGSVVDQEGDAVPNARIQLMRPVYRRRSLHWQSAGQAITNDKGEYHLTSVQPGEYRVMAIGHYQQALRIRPEAIAGQAVQEELFSPQFYPGAASIEAAASLTLKAGNDLKGIDFTLSTTPQLTVNGTIHPPAGMEKEGSVNIQFLAESRTGSGELENFGAAAPDYTFQANLSAGRYHVLALADAKDRSYRADQWVDVGPGTDNLSITLTPGTPLAGKLIVEGESLRQHGPYTIHLTSGEDLPLNGRTPETEVGDTGVFEFSSVFSGIWDIGVDPIPPGSYIKSMRLGDQDVLTEDMKLEEGTRKQLIIVLSTKAALVSGNVLASDGAGPLTTVRSRVLLAPCGKYEGVLGFYKTTVTDSKGHFEFKGITPGTYRIYAFDRLQLDEYWKPDFLKPFTPWASDVFQVAEGARVPVDAKLIVRDPEGGE